VRTDLELLSAWSAGDLRAGDALFRRHFLAVVRFFRNKADADHEDLIQRTFLGCLEARTRFRGESSFRTFLLGVACNVLRGYYRSKYRSRETLDLGECSLYDLSPSPSAIVARNQEEQVLLEALRRISLDYQIVLELYFWEELTAAEIAAALEIPLGTAQTRLRRAREQLARRMEELVETPGLAAAVALNAEVWARGLRGRIAGGAELPG